MTETEKQKLFNFGVASSLVLFGFDGDTLRILINKRTEDPFEGAFILPSVYIYPEESIEEKVVSMIHQYLDSKHTYIEQLKAFVKVFRNPVGRVINVSYYALIKLDDELKENTKKFNGKWLPYHKIPELAYDHNEIIDYAKERLKRRVKRRPIGFYLLPEEFTILQLQKLYEQALNKELDKRNFRKKITKSDLIIETDKEDTSSKKPAKLYKFDQDNYEKLTLKGYDFLF